MHYRWSVFHKKCLVCIFCSGRVFGLIWIARVSLFSKREGKEALYKTVVTFYSLPVASSSVAQIGYERNASK